MNSAHSTKIRLLLIDDHALFREGLARLLGSETDFEVAPPCSNVDEALQVLQTTAIDLILLDYDLGQETGARFLVRASEAGFQGRVLIVTAGLAESEAADLLRHGAAGIFLKHNSPGLLAKAAVEQEQLNLLQRKLNAARGQLSFSAEDLAQVRRVEQTRQARLDKDSDRAQKAADQHAREAEAATLALQQFRAQLLLKPFHNLIPDRGRLAIGHGFVGGLIGEIIRQ